MAAKTSAAKTVRGGGSAAGKTKAAAKTITAKIPAGGTATVKKKGKGGKC